MALQTELLVHLEFKPVSHPSSRDSSFLLDFTGRLGDMDGF